LSALLEARGLAVRYRLAGGLLHPRWLTAVEGASLSLATGGTLGVVGESGCGKSTLGRALIGLTPVAAGELRWQGQRVDGLTERGWRRLRREVQIVFQDPLASLDPRMTVGQSVAEPLAVFEPRLTRRERRARVGEALERVGLAAALADRYPHEFSGGQAQRIGIARAVILRPRLVVCDEPVSALDVSVQGQVVNLLRELRDDLGLAYLFISHNLAVVRHLSDAVMVMYLGRVMESGPREAIYARPLHPYTRMLLDAVPVADPAVERRRRRSVVAGELPSPLAPPSGCVFRSRCPLAEARCAERRPEPEEAAQGHRVACHRWREWPAGLTPAAGR
jgi:oligopeptide transport system ATP-binding protein